MEFLPILKKHIVSKIVMTLVTAMMLSSSCQEIKTCDIEKEMLETAEDNCKIIRQKFQLYSDSCLRFFLPAISRDSTAGSWYDGIYMSCLGTNPSIKDSLLAASTAGDLAQKDTATWNDCTPVFRKNVADAARFGLHGSYALEQKDISDKNVAIRDSILKICKANL